MTNTSARVIRVLAAVAVVCGALTGCTKQASAPTTGAPPTAVAANPSTFPLYQPSTVVSVAPFDQANMARTMNAHLSGGQQRVVPYKGNEVLASSPASLADLRAWLDKQKASPPEGLQVSGSAHGMSGNDVKVLNDWGADAVSFQNGSGRAVVVIVMDPKKVKGKLGPALDLIDKYQALPTFVRGPIDEKAKAQFGVSVSEMLDRSGPLGLFVAAVKELGTTNDRALILVDGTKETS